MANEKEKQTIDEIEKTVEELRKKIELLTTGQLEAEDNSNESSSDGVSINIEYDNLDNHDVLTQGSEQAQTQEEKDWVKLIGDKVNDIKQGLVDFTNDPKVVSAKENAKEKSIKALDQLKDTLHDLKENENIINASEKAKDAFNSTMNTIDGFVHDSMAGISEIPEVKKVMGDISTGLNKSGEAIKDFVNSEQVQGAIEKAKDGAINGSQKFADFVKEKLSKD